MTRDNNPDRLDDGARAEAEMKERAAKPLESARHNEQLRMAEELGFERGMAAALPAPQGDDGLVDEADEMASELVYIGNQRCSQDHSDWGNMIAKLCTALRSQASEIERWAKNALDNDDSRIAAEAESAGLWKDMAVYADTIRRADADVLSEFIKRTAADARLASAMEALTEISERHIPDQPAYDAGSDYAWVCRQYASLRTIARTTLSSLKGSAE